jgi:hypothetical protein
MRPALLALAVAAAALAPCAAEAAASPDAIALHRTVTAADIVVVEHVVARPTPAIPDRIAVETLSTGDHVDVVVYQHVYADPIEVYPHVWWAGRWYYNVNGNLVFWDPVVGVWAHYWGPPVGLVHVWNHHHPHVAFAWGVGFYGPGYYWGGVASTGWHVHGRPPRHYHRGEPYRPSAGKPLKQIKQAAVRPTTRAPSAGESSAPRRTSEPAERTKAQRAEPQTRAPTNATPRTQGPPSRSQGPTRAPAPSRAKPPAPSRADVPAPSRAKAPSPSRAKAPAPARSHAPSPSRSKAPSASRGKAPSPSRSRGHGPSRGR